MPDTESPSVAAKVTKELDDIGALRKSRPRYFWVLVAGVVLFGADSLFQRFWGLPAAKEEVASLKGDLATVKDERDAARTQLAPFLAAANAKFGTAPADDRLDLLLTGVMSIEHGMANALAQADAADRKAQAAQERADEIERKAAPRAYTNAQAHAAVALLKAAGPHDVKISRMGGDGDTARMQTGISTVFALGGWNVHRNVALDQVALGIGVRVKAEPGPPGTQAALDALAALGLPRNLWLDDELPAERLEIVVGAKPL